MSTISLFYLDPLIVWVNSRADDVPREENRENQKNVS